METLEEHDKTARQREGRQAYCLGATTLRRLSPLLARDSSREAGRGRFRPHAPAWRSSDRASGGVDRSTLPPAVVFADLAAHYQPRGH